jgi:toxin CcdB
MAQFDVYRLAGGELALDVQTDLLVGIRTRVVVPLLPVPGPVVAHPRLNPLFEIDGVAYILVPQSIIALDRGEAGPVVANLDANYDEIRAALDMIFNGFSPASRLR